MVLPVDDVADPPDREAEADPRRRGVGAVPDRHATTHGDDEATENPADRRSPDRDPAGPDLRDLLGVLEIEREMVDDVHDARTQDSADDAPGRDRVAVVLRDAIADQAERERRAEEDADRREDAVPRERDRSDVHVGVEGKFDHGLSARDIS